MEFKYLIVKCEELHDQYECDADREPVRLTNDASIYGIGYEVYEIRPDGSLDCIKGYEQGLESGMAVYHWGATDNPEECAPIVTERYKGMSSSEVTKSMVKQIKKRVGFTNTVNEIYLNILDCGNYGEEINGEWVVFGEYIDTRFDVGY